MKKISELKIGIVDADLLDNGTRHPNLALLKIAGLLYDNHVWFELITSSTADISIYDYIYMSRVFTFTNEPSFYVNATEKDRRKFCVGGTGYYANETNVSIYREKRNDDMTRLERDPLLSILPNKYGDPSHPRGILMPRQMPYYKLYNKYIEKKIGPEDPASKEWRKRRLKYKDYLDYSIGFLTRGCVRHCPFCINRLEQRVVKNSELEWFYDRSRPHVYFWDDNFLAAPKKIWKPILQKLIDENISFQFRQGLDERQFAESPDGEEMARMLAASRYHGDYIFAFDNWKDKDTIVRSLKIWKHYNPTHPTKFYLFCGFKQKADRRDEFFTDIWHLFQRIKILMQYGCIGYVMRHEDYHDSPIENLYIQVARWCNQPAFYKKMSFWEYCYRNQSYWEQSTLKNARKTKLISFRQFTTEYNAGRYVKIKLCRPIRTLLQFMEMFVNKRTEILEMINYKFSDLKDPKLWEVD